MSKPEKPIVCYVTDRRSLTPQDSGGEIALLLQKIGLAINARVDWLQIREKDLPGGRLLALTREAIYCATQTPETGHPCLTPGVPVRGARIYLNDRLDVALAAAAEPHATAEPHAIAGVHLGAESLPLEAVVRWRAAGNVPPYFQIGVSCHSAQQARKAEQDGANHIFFGPIFDTPSKRPYGPPQGLGRLQEVSAALQIPVIAIGGINESNAQDCIRAGASGVAAIRLFQESSEADHLVRFISSITQTKPGGTPSGVN
jgi:thiamine-phosphate pyrophosphorylase